MFLVRIKIYQGINLFGGLVEEIQIRFRSDLSQEQLWNCVAWFRAKMYLTYYLIVAEFSTDWSMIRRKKSKW